MSMEICSMKVILQSLMLKDKDPEELSELIFAKVKERYDEKEDRLSPEQMREFEKVIVLRAVDQNGLTILMRWISFVKEFIFVHMVKLIRLREYQHEGFAMFEDMVASIEDEVAQYIMKAEIRNNLERQEVIKGQAVNPKEDGEKVKKKPLVKQAEIGRNDPCPAEAEKNIKTVTVNCRSKL